MKRLLLLGSTGSIGTQTLDCVRASPGALAIEALAARSSVAELAAQAHEFRPRRVALADETRAEELARALPAGCELLTGERSLEELARTAEYDVCVNGLVGAAGVRPSARVLERGLVLALANKESLVAAGGVLMPLARECGATILPVDSEHCAIHQCLAGADPGTVRRVILTASGGPFRTASAESIAAATPEVALRHPNWDMGPRITVGSATLMNKAFEVIELHHLFGLERERIDVVVHPQSLVHSLVEFVDGSVLAQLGPPDMRGPIHYCLHWPERVVTRLEGFDVRRFRELSFEPPDHERFPALGLGFRCVEEGSDSGAVLNAADEVAVAAFLAGRIRLPEIAAIVTRALNQRPGRDDSLEALLTSDRWARGFAAAAADELAAARR